MKLYVFIVVIFCFFTVFTSSLEARQGRMRGRENKSFAYERINMTDEQRAVVKELNDEHFKDMAELRNKISAASEELREEIEKQESDLKRINEISERIKNAQSKILDLRTQHILGLKDLLSPEQFAELNKMRRQGALGRSEDESKGKRPRAKDGAGPRGQGRKGK